MWSTCFPKTLGRAADLAPGVTARIYRLWFILGYHPAHVAQRSQRNASQRNAANTSCPARSPYFAARTLAIGCGTCKRQRLLLPVPDRLVIYGGSMKVGQIVSRVRCAAPGCGARPSRIVISNRLHEVPLVGQGRMTK